MENIISSSNKIGDIVAAFPDASEIFKAYGIDFCCGGNRPLADAIREQGLDENEVIRKLKDTQAQAEKINTGAVNWRQASSADLIDYVVKTHHAYLKRELPELSALVTKILQVHGSRHGDVLLGVHRLFHSLKTELDQHLFKEEEILFPLIKQYDISPSSQLLEKVAGVMKETEDEHEGAGDILKELRRITNQYEVPADGCTTYMLTFRRLEAMEADLFQHIHLENNILFPRFIHEPDCKTCRM